MYEPTSDRQIVFVDSDELLWNGSVLQKSSRISTSWKGSFVVAGDLTRFMDRDFFSVAEMRGSGKHIKSEIGADQT
jgi:hypothetical protein